MEAWCATEDHPRLSCQIFVQCVTGHCCNNVPSHSKVIISTGDNKRSEELYTQSGTDTPAETQDDTQSGNVAGSNQEVARTRRGRKVRKPACYCLVVEGPAFQGDGRCKGADHESNHESQEHM